MHWRDVKQNWEAFMGRIEDRWPGVDQNELIRIDGDRGAFVRYIAELRSQPRDEAEDEIAEWLAGDLPTDVLMDPHHDNESILESGRHIHPGEDVYDDDKEFGDDAAAEPPVGRDT